MIAKLPQMIAAGCLLICVVSGIRAASAADAPRQPENSGQAAVSDRELSSFVKAYVDYQRIRSQYAPALAKEKDPTRKKQIEQEANTKVKRSFGHQWSVAGTLQPNLRHGQRQRKLAQASSQTGRRGAEEFLSLV
jgi:hypothetical protein